MKSTKAFTLIELLVVIAIIAILAAILFPVFAQAKEAAKKTQALSNVKEQALGLLMYSNDYDDYNPRSQWDNFLTGYPSTTFPSSGVVKEYWEAAITPYIKNGNQIGVSEGGQGSIWADPDFKENPNQSDQFGVHSGMMPACTEYSGSTPSACPSVQSSTSVNSPATIVSIALKGAFANYGSSFPDIDTDGTKWLSSTEITAYKAVGQTGATPDTEARYDGDCDYTIGYYAYYGGCASLPRYLHNENGSPTVAYTKFGQATNISSPSTSGNTIAAYFDGHAKSAPKGSLSWGANFHVPGVNDLQ